VESHNTPTVRNHNQPCDWKEIVQCKYEFGPFLYNKPPFERREKIIWILPQPVLSRDNDQDRGIEYTRFQLEFLPDPFHHHYMNCSTEWSHALPEEAAERVWKTECCPGQENLYLLTLNPARTQYHSGLSKGWVFLGWLRRVSHVSTSFRHELCKVLWAHTIVDT
jgi:hypothetical protein